MSDLCILYVKASLSKILNPQISYICSWCVLGWCCIKKDHLRNSMGHPVSDIKCIVTAVSCYVKFFSTAIINLTETLCLKDYVRLYRICTSAVHQKQNHAMCWFIPILTHHMLNLTLFTYVLAEFIFRFQADAFVVNRLALWAVLQCL